MWQLEAFSVRSRQMVVALFGALLIMLCCGLGWYVIGQLERSSERALVAKSVVADVLPPPMYLVEMRLVLSQAVEGTLDPAKATAEVDRLQHDYEGRVRHWQSTPLFGLERHLLGDQHRYGTEFIGATRKVLQALADGRRDEARSLLAQSHESYLQHRREVDRTVVEGSRMADAEAEIMARSSGRARGGLLLILMLGLTGMGALAWLISRSIVQPLQTAVGVAEAVAAGNLAVSVPTSAARSDDQHELGKLQAALGRMCHGLGLIVSQVRSAGLGAAEASAQLAAGNQDLRSRTQQHQQELENCCASLKEVAGLVEQNAGSAQNAKELASVVSGMAGRGIGVVDELAALMRTISGSSGRVGEIVSLIESIAFQTNLLALNAAVEAARAGEQGRGFAVVAAEVRQLANRSSRAAAEIKTLVEGSGAEIAEGSRHAVSVETTIKDMVTQVEAMSRLVVEIWENTFTQSSAINLLTDSMQVLADASSANVALVTQTSGLASKLQSDAADLARSVSVFTLPGAARPAFRGG